MHFEAHTARENSPVGEARFGTATGLEHEQILERRHKEKVTKDFELLRKAFETNNFETLNAMSLLSDIGVDETTLALLDQQERELYTLSEALKNTFPTLPIAKFMDLFCLLKEHTLFDEFIYTDKFCDFLNSKEKDLHFNHFLFDRLSKEEPRCGIKKLTLRNDQNTQPLDPGSPKEITRDICYLSEIPDGVVYIEKNRGK
jgi:hypothetical protein